MNEKERRTGAALGIENAAASVEMEGYTIDSKSKEWCQKLLRNEITMQEYISLVKKKAGVKA